MRNLWLQGEGWVGMKEFAYLYSPELNAIHPGLAEKYQELDRLYRLGQLAQLALVPLPEMVDQIPKEMMSQVREIVTSDYEIVESVDGYFSLPPGVFVHVNRLLFDSNFESSRALQAEAREILKESGVME